MAKLCKICGELAVTGLGLYCRKHKLERQTMLNRVRRAGGLGYKADRIGSLSDSELRPRLAFVRRNKAKLHGGSTLEIWPDYKKEQSNG